MCVNRKSSVVCTRPRPGVVCPQNTARYPFSGSSPGPGRLRASSRSTWLWCPCPATGIRTWWPASWGCRWNLWRYPSARSSRCRSCTGWSRRKTCCPCTSSSPGWQMLRYPWPRRPPEPTGKPWTEQSLWTFAAAEGCTSPRRQPCPPCYTGTPTCTAIGNSEPAPEMIYENNEK